MANEFISFNVPYMSGGELSYIEEAHRLGMLAGDGAFTIKCHEWLQDQLQTPKALLTHSCTAALELAALALDLRPGDEVIVPSYTFVSTANAFALRGAVPVFVDVREDTLNLDETLIETAITSKTRAIVPVHYAGIACEMDAVLKVARKHNLSVVEDAAQGMGATYKAKPLGSLGTLGALSFHETKNVISGEGGAVLVNDGRFELSVEIAREKGTDRTRFKKGEIDKYTWQSLGSSFLPGELIAAFLWAQLQKAEYIAAKRLEAWNYYHNNLSQIEDLLPFRTPVVPDECAHSGHMYYVLLDEGLDRNKLLRQMNEAGVGAVFHYVPLHLSPAGQKYCRTSGQLPVTESAANRIIRLPLWIGITPSMQDRVMDVLLTALK